MSEKPIEKKLPRLEIVDRIYSGKSTIYIVRECKAADTTPAG